VRRCRIAEDQQDPRSQERGPGRNRDRENVKDPAALPGALHDDGLLLKLGLTALAPKAEASRFNALR
jgi:hypothetical protein